MAGILLAPLLVNLLSASALQHGGGTTVTFTPWCGSSMRVRVAPATLPPAAEAAAAALSRSLADKGMADLPGALVTTSCTPGAAVHPTAGGEKTTNGNLEAALAADGSISFTRADTGVVLFSVTPSFSFNGGGGGGGDKPAPWQAVVNQSVTCSETEFNGNVGRSTTSAKDCLAAAMALPTMSTRINCKEPDIVIVNIAVHPKPASLTQPAPRYPPCRPAEDGQGDPFPLPAAVRANLAKT